MDAKKETEQRVQFIKDILQSSHAKGIVYGNSGGKDSALVGILCKMACDNTTGIIMPCSSKRNYSNDMQDALKVADKFDIKTLNVDLTPVKDAFMLQASHEFELNENAQANVNPRLRMITLYAYAVANNCIVAGTGNASEAYMGYFTKWGDGAHDFNPIADMFVSEIYELLEYLGAPEEVITKAPSAALREGQTDEGEMGVKYAQIESYIKNGPKSVDEKSRAIIKKLHEASEHKRNAIPVYKK